MSVCELFALLPKLGVHVGFTVSQLLRRARFLVTTVHTLLCLCLTDCKHAVRPRLPGLVALLLVRLQRCNQTDVAFHRRRVR